MRNLVLGCATMLSGLVASPPAPAAPSYAAPRIVLPVRASQLPDPIPAFPGLRPRTVHVPAPPPPREFFGWLLARTEIRDARPILDFRPLSRSAFHVSVGTRFFAGYDAALTSPDTDIALTFDPRRPSRPIALRDGFERFAPIVLVGFERPIGGGWRAGVDAGAMLGRAVSLYPYVDRPSGLPGPNLRQGDPLNPVGAVTLSYDF